MLSAYLGGVKANYGTIGLTASVNLNNCSGQNDTANHVESIAKWAQDYGMSTGNRKYFVIKEYILLFFRIFSPISKYPKNIINMNGKFIAVLF